MTHSHPQNPYESYLVAASAGCGKTYQLSQRFLFLVASGADPAQILTVTYTRKAVAEMRERIVADAMKLAGDTGIQEEFERRIRDFYAGAVESAQAQDRPSPPPPRSARETAEVILAATQTIRISTIDSIFYEWSNKFGDELAGEKEFIPTPVTMTGTLEKQHLNEQSEQEAYRLFMRQAARVGEGESIRLEDLPGQSFDDAMTQARSLELHNTYIWACGDSSALLQHLVDESVPVDEQSCVQGLTGDLGTIIGRINNPDTRSACLDALSAKSLVGLQNAGLVTKDHTISKSKIKGRIRDAVAAEVARVDSGIQAFKNAEKIRQLNRQGAVVFRIRQLLQEARTSYKQKHRLAEFTDLTKVVYKLFAMEAAAGTRYLIQRSVRHILLDEFQDTSRSQWFVFRTIATELMAGEGLAESDSRPGPGTVFLVGDEKQSVYGYREADPEVLLDAAGELAPLGLKFAPLNASYRSAQLVLDFVNEVFSDQHVYLSDFPRHQTALQKNAPVIPDAGRVTVQPVVLPDPGRPLVSTDEIEAEVLAAHLKNVLSGEIPSPIWDKSLNAKQGAYRKIRPGDCAILYRAKTKVQYLETALRQANIPFVREDAQGFFERPEIMDAINLFSFFAKPSDMTALCGVLRSPFGGLSNAALQKILLDTASLSGSPERSGAILRRLNENQVPVGIALIEALKAAGRKEAPSSSDIFRNFMIATGALEAYRMSYPAPDDALAAANLTRFAEILLDLESKGSRTFAVQLRAFMDLAKLDETGTLPPATDAVRLMTIHKSKGLEFPFVAIVGTATDWLGTERYWLRGKDHTGRPGIYYVGRSDDRPEADPHFEQIQSNLTELNHAEMRRLLYVALTRARQYLYISGNTKDPTGIDDTYLGLLLAARARMPTCETPDLHTLIPHDQTSIDSDPVNSPQELGTGNMREVFAKANAAVVLPILPAEVRVNFRSTDKTSPSADKQAVVTFDRDSARIHGLMVHGILELAAVGSSLWQSVVWQERKWQELLHSLPPGHESGIFGSKSSSEALRQATAEAGKVLESSVWREITAGATAIVPECPLAMLDGNELFSGRADLLVQKQNGDIWAIDYKTSAAESSDLKAFAIAQGFDQQVERYAKALRAAFPERTIKGALLFTASRTLVEL